MPWGSPLNTSPIDYLIGLRIQKSLALLTGNELNITGAVFRVGFTDSNYFARQFRRRMGLTPREFQRQAKPRTKVTEHTSASGDRTAFSRPCRPA